MGYNSWGYKTVRHDLVTKQQLIQYFIQIKHTKIIAECNGEGKVWVFFFFFHKTFQELVKQISKQTKTTLLCVKEINNSHLMHHVTHQSKISKTDN